MKKEKILVSACLLGVNCKYNGGNNYSSKVFDYLKDKEVFPICPEQLGGLSTPRVAAERRNDRVITKDNNDVTEYFVNGANEVLKLAKMFDIKKALLKSKSPSCGKNKIYDGSFSSILVDKNGVTAEVLMSNGIEVISSDEI